jgi:hypothetical protein
VLFWREKSFLLWWHCTALWNYATGIIPKALCVLFSFLGPISAFLGLYKLVHVSALLWRLYANSIIQIIFLRGSFLLCPE